MSLVFFAQTAEARGFEPPVPFDTQSFQDCRLSRSRTLPSKLRIAHYKAKIKLFCLILIISVFPFLHINTLSELFLSRFHVFGLVFIYSLISPRDLSLRIIWS